ncbi:MAG: hypothetical protein WAS49_07600 [Candidatus Dechloromonas phosphoritropha]|jgi:hypothetical protein|nr:hypothetical protein [Candidatus Dechloromonas phosphoritropha]MBP8788598.1 hypothetical protein [Azonexus sp.]MBP9229082.1 hypothetical protein [Azonexus sp.]
MNSFKKFSSALTLSCLCIGFAYAQDPANVAKVTEANGKVLVNKGNGLVSTKAGTLLVDGDRIVTLDKSNARVIFSDGYELVLEENKILVIDMKLGSKSAVLASEPAAGAVAAGGSLPEGLWIVGIIGAGGALLAGANSNNNNSDNRPISGQ